MSSFDHVLGVVSQTRVSGVNRTHDPEANSLAHYQLDYQGTQLRGIVVEMTIDCCMAASSSVEAVKVWWTTISWPCKIPSSLPYKIIYGRGIKWLKITGLYIL